MTVALERREWVDASTKLAHGIHVVREGLVQPRRFSNLWGWRIKDQFELLRLIPNEDFPTWLAGRPYRLQHSDAESLLRDVAETLGLKTNGLISKMPQGGEIELCPPHQGIHLVRIHYVDSTIDLTRTDWHVATEERAGRIVESHIRSL